MGKKKRKPINAQKNIESNNFTPKTEKRPANDINMIEIRNCSCRRKGYCIIREDKCLPSSFKCIKNKSVFGNSVLAFDPEASNSNKGKKSSRYDPWVEERYGTNKNISVLNMQGRNVVLHVFKGFLNLKKEYTIDYYVKVKDIRNNRSYNILVAYNRRTGNYYISDTQIKWLHKNSMFPDAIFRVCNEGSIPLMTDDFQEFSKLALYGYSAGKHGLDAENRHKILGHVIDKNIMSKYEIVEHLQGLISLREDRTDKDFSVAINNWRQDIRFVNDYHAPKGQKMH